WVCLGKVAPGFVPVPFGCWQTKVKRWLPWAASTFKTTCPFFFPLVATPTVAVSVQSVPGVAVALNCSRAFAIPTNPGPGETLICTRSAESHAVAVLVEKQRLARRSQGLSLLLSEYRAGSPSLQRVERVNEEPLASLTWRRQRADAGDTASSASERVKKAERMDRMSFPTSEGRRLGRASGDPAADRVDGGGGKWAAPQRHRPALAPRPG